MKTNIKFQLSLWVLMGIILFSFDGCRADLLDIAPKNAASSENIWSSANLAEQVVTGVYNRLRNEISGANNRPMFDVMGSATDFDYNWRGDLPFLHGGPTPSSGIYINYWRLYYEVVHRANDVIANIDKVPDMSDALKAQRKAECKFLRAIFYYRLNVLYHGVPIYLEPVEVADCIKPRSTEKEVWDVIISDLTDCINEPNLPNKYASNNSNYGRVTKAAAYAMRGKMYLWLEDWAKAEQDFKAITAMGEYSLFGDYKTLFKVQNERCDEMIFSVQFIEQSGYGQNLTRAYGNRSTGTSDGAGAWNNYIVNPSLAETFECDDGKPFNWDDFLPGYSSMTPQKRSVFFLRDNMTEAEITTMTNFGAEMSLYLSEGNEARIKAAYDNRDPRLRLNIITPYSIYNGGRDGSAMDYTLRWPYRNRTAPYFDVQTDTNSKFYYLGRKFVPEGREHLNMEFNPIDFPLIRYADVLLSLAEALNEQGKTTEAITYVNQVRARVNHQLLNSNSHTTVSGQADMRQRIRNECYYEFPFENHTYFNELRWKTWKDKKFFPGNGMREIWGLATYTYTWVGDQNWTWPIPATERQMNSNLTQNPGWID